MIITNQIRAKILASLPHDFNKKVQEITRCSATTVTNVLHHGHPNYEVAKSLINLAAIYQLRARKLADKAMTLPSKCRAA